MLTASERRPVVFLMGPTASGKTGLAVELVQQWPMDIVSVDSAMIYRGMDIGTAKPNAATLARAPHRLIDFLDPALSYSAAQFAADARREIADIHAQGRIPLLVGGTMLYYRALYSGLSELPDADAGVRLDIDQQAGDLGWPALHARLAKLDALTAARIHPNDAQRIQRALEIIELTGKGPSEHAQPKADFPWPCLKLVVNPPDRAVLHARIEQRFLSMMDEGLLAEVEVLRQRKDLNLDCPSVRCVGYRQLWRHLDGDWGLDEAVQRGIAATRQLAKRQLTWLRNEQEALWLDSTREDYIDSAVQLLRKNQMTAIVERGG